MLTWFFNTETEFGLVWYYEKVKVSYFGSFSHLMPSNNMPSNALVCPKQIAYSRLQA